MQQSTVSIESQERMLSHYLEDGKLTHSFTEITALCG